MTNNINVPCPHCKCMAVVMIRQDDPMNFGMIYKYQCQHCGKIMDAEELSSYSDSNNATSSAEKYCQNCNTKMEYFGDGGWWVCPNCHYGYMDYIGDLPDDMEDISKKLLGYEFCVPCDNAWGVSKLAVSENMLPQTLTIANCEKIKMHHKEMDIDFEFDTNKLKNIDTIIINGYKYIKEI